MTEAVPRRWALRFGIGAITARHEPESGGAGLGRQDTICGRHNGDTCPGRRRRFSRCAPDRRPPRPPLSRRRRPRCGRRGATACPKPSACASPDGANVEVVFDAHDPDRRDTDGRHGARPAGVKRQVTDHLGPLSGRHLRPMATAHETNVATGPRGADAGGRTGRGERGRPPELERRPALQPELYAAVRPPALA